MTHKPHFPPCIATEPQNYPLSLSRSLSLARPSRKTDRLMRSHRWKSVPSVFLYGRSPERAFVGRLPNTIAPLATHHIPKPNFALLSVYDASAADTEYDEAEGSRESNVEIPSLRCLGGWLVVVIRGFVGHHNGRARKPSCFTTNWVYRIDIECDVVEGLVLKPFLRDRPCNKARRSRRGRRLKGNRSSFRIEIVCHDINQGIRATGRLRLPGHIKGTHIFFFS